MVRLLLLLGVFDLGLLQHNIFIECTDRGRLWKCSLYFLLLTRKRTLRDLISDCIIINNTNILVLGNAPRGSLVDGHVPGASNVDGRDRGGS